MDMEGTSRGTIRGGVLRHCATIQKVAGSIPDGVNKIFHSVNPSGRNYSTGVVSSSYRDEYQGCLLGVKAVG
jgi:hypothetical protein